MTLNIIRRLLSALFVMFAVSVLTFLIFEKIPNGSPALRMAGRTATAATIHQINQEYGFNRPIWIQYLHTMSLIFRGDVYSYTQRINVLHYIVSALPATISLAVGACSLSLIFGVVLGTFCASRAGKLSDRIVSGGALIGVSTPTFFVAALLLYYLSYEVPIFPSGGYVSLLANPIQWLYHMLLPWLTLSMLGTGVYARLLRGQMLDHMHDDFIRTARAKGVGRRRVLAHHLLRNSIMPVISVWGLDFAATIGGGAILIETVFNLHGVGQFAATSIADLDVPPLLVIVMFAAFLVVIVGGITELVNSRLDPRSLATGRGK